MLSICPTWVHWLQQIFNHLALNQKLIEISAWNFQHLFITCLRKFDKEILAIAQSACQPRPISAKTLDASSDRICWDILKRKNWWGSRPIWVSSWKEFSISLRKWRFEIFHQAEASNFTMFTPDLVAEILADCNSSALPINSSVSGWRVVFSTSSSLQKLQIHLKVLVQGES